MKHLIILLIFVSGCSGLLTSKPKEGKLEYSYTDVSGRFKYLREQKLTDRKLVTRTQLLLPSGGTFKNLEKSITVSHLGSIKDKNGRVVILRPEASEFSVWLEGKNYSSRMSIDEKNKSMKVSLDSPESKWKGVSLIPFPKGRNFCFYSQLPECLYHSGMLKRALSKSKESVDLFIIWDSYPYIQDQLTGVGSKLFTSANFKYDGMSKSVYKFVLELEGQIIVYHFSKSFDLIKLAWIAQGITIVPPGEEASPNDDM